MGSEEISPFFLFWGFPSLLFFLFAFLHSSLILLEEKGKRLQFPAKWGISLRPSLHRPRAKLPHKTMVLAFGSSLHFSFYRLPRKKWLEFREKGGLDFGFKFDLRKGVGVLLASFES